MPNESHCGRCMLLLFACLLSSACSNPWDGVDSGPYQVFDELYRVSMLDVLPAEQDRYGHVILFVKTDDGAVFSPLMFRRSTVVGSGGSRDDIEGIMHTLTQEQLSDGTQPWSDFPVPVDSRINEYMVLYRGPYERGTSAGDIDEGWRAARYTLSELQSRRPQPEDFTSTPDELVGANWVGLFGNAKGKRGEYRS